MVDRLQAGMYNLDEGGGVNEHSLVSSGYACDVGSSVSDGCGIFDKSHHKHNQ